MLFFFFINKFYPTLACGFKNCVFKRTLKKKTLISKNTLFFIAYPKRLAKKNPNLFRKKKKKNSLTPLLPFLTCNYLFASITRRFATTNRRLSGSWTPIQAFNFQPYSLCRCIFFSLFLAKLQVYLFLFVYACQSPRKREENVEEEREQKHDDSQILSRWLHPN